MSDELQVTDLKIIPFLLEDPSDPTKKIAGAFNIYRNSIEIQFDGYSTCYEDDEEGTPIYLEIQNGVPQVHVWPDINSEEMLHLNLEKAAIENREEASVEID